MLHAALPCPRTIGKVLKISIDINPFTGLCRKQAVTSGGGLAFDQLNATGADDQKIQGAAPYMTAKSHSLTGDLREVAKHIRIQLQSQREQMFNGMTLQRDQLATFH
ncbi:hypothetical protein C405_19784 [Stenotrophomonas maltophilia AU12-09]|nr:hypothetical protein C405_19784 [Stenotrophomonas maltophilia AU12-09]